MNAAFSLRPATLADRQFLFELRKSTIDLHLVHAGILLSDADHYQRVDEAFSCSYVVCSNEQSVGLPDGSPTGSPLGLVKYIEDEHTLTLLQLQISPQWQNKGLGRAIVEHLIHLACHKPIKLTVLKQNPALALYHRLGFNYAGEDEYEFALERHPNQV